MTRKWCTEGSEESNYDNYGFNCDYLMYTKFNELWKIDSFIGKMVNGSWQRTNCQ